MRGGHSGTDRTGSEFPANRAGNSFMSKVRQPGDRQDWQRISGKMRRKSVPVLSVPGALVGGDEVTMAVFHELSRAERPSQQTGPTANFQQTAPEIHASLVSPRGQASFQGFW